MKHPTMSVPPLIEPINALNHKRFCGFNLSELWTRYMTIDAKLDQMIPLDEHFHSGTEMNHDLREMRLTETF